MCVPAHGYVCKEPFWADDGGWGWYLTLEVRRGLRLGQASRNSSCLSMRFLWGPGLAPGHLWNGKMGSRLGLSPTWSPLLTPAGSATKLTLRN